VSSNGFYLNYIFAHFNYLMMAFHKSRNM